MARRVKIGQDGQTTRTSSAEQTKALANVSVAQPGQDDSAKGSSFVFEFNDDDRGNRDLDAEGALRAYYESPPVHMAVSAIGRSVGETELSWVDGDEPDMFSFAQPNRWHQSAELFGLMAAYLKLTGSCYLIKVEGAAGPELLPIPKHHIEEPDTRSGKWRLEDGNTPLLGQSFDRDELVIIHEPSLLDPFMKGRGSGQSVGSDADIHDAAAEHTASTLENRARPDLLVSIPGANKKQVDRFRNSMRQKHGGPGNSGKLEVFGSKGLTTEALNTSFDELGLTDLRRHSAQVIRQVFGIPPSIVGDVSDTNRATAETEEYLFKKNVVRPLVRKIIEALNEQFVKVDLGENLELTHGKIVPEDRRFVAQLMTDIPQAFRVDEARQLAGFEPMDGAEGEQTLAEADPSTVQRAHEPAQPKGCGHDHGKKKRQIYGSSRKPRTTSGSRPSSRPSTRRI